MTRLTPGSARPRSARNASRSASSSCAISSSTLPHTATSPVAARARNGESSKRAEAAAGSTSAGTSASSRLSTISRGLAERNWKPRSSFRSSPDHLEAAQRRAVLERGAAALEQVALALELRRAPLLQVALDPFKAFLDHAEIRQDQLVLHRLRVGIRTDGLGVMGDAGVAEGAHDVNERVGVAKRGDVEQGLGGRATRRRQVRELDGGRRVLARAVQLGQAVEPLVRHLRDAHARLELGVPRPGSLALARHQLEEGGLPRGGEADQGGPQHSGRHRITTRRRGSGES